MPFHKHNNAMQSCGAGHILTKSATYCELIESWPHQSVFRSVDIIVHILVAKLLCRRQATRMLPCGEYMLNASYAASTTMYDSNSTASGGSAENGYLSHDNDATGARNRAIRAAPARVYTYSFRYVEP
eukprot:scaffold81696_cov18-Prasinocladus_malaysianus.AAC.1